MADLVVSSIGQVLAATADTYDVVTLDEIKPGLNIPGATTTFDARLAMVITAVSQRLVDLCGPIVDREFTDEKYDGGECDVFLRNAGCSPTATTTISTVKEYDTGGTLTTLTAETYSSKPADAYLLSSEVGERHRLIRRSGGYDYPFACGRANVLVTYTSGRAANTAAVASKFKQAALIAINHVHSTIGAQSGAARVGQIDGLPYGVPPFAMPKAALDMLRDELRAGGVG